MFEFPVTAKQDSEPERNETFSVGFWQDDRWHGCTITIIDDDSPWVTDVENLLQADRGGTAAAVAGPISRTTGIRTRAGESIDVTVSFDAEVEVDGLPTISLYLGDGDGAWRGARYHSASGSRQLIYRYQVEPRDRDDDGISVSAAAVNQDRSPRNGFSRGV